MAPTATTDSTESLISQCEQEPIHLLGSIQPVGVLLAVDAENLRVVSVSGNLPDLLDTRPEQAIGVRIDRLFGEPLADRAREAIKNLAPNQTTLASLRLEHDGAPIRHDLLFVRQEGQLLIEIELQPHGDSDPFHELFVPIRDALWKLDGENDLNRYSQAVVDQVRLLNGFDRVMMYRFGTEWDGEVIAESRIEDIGSYLGNHFPASDIPVQARDLYVRNLVRQIADVGADPVALYSGDAADRPIDLSLSWFRSLSPVHVEYLQNMGVKASLSISLVQNGHLWGLIACHHLSPRYISIRERELNELIGRTVSLKLSNMEHGERASFAQRIRQLLYDFTELLRRSRDLEAVVKVMQGTLLDLVRATGAILVVNGKRHELGELPPPVLVEHAVAGIRRSGQKSAVYHTRRMGEWLSDAPADPAPADHAYGGMLLVPLDATLTSYLAWFRPSLLRTMRWAGRPDKMVIREDGQTRISPRKSFETWIETHRTESEPWLRTEIDAATSLSLALTETLSEQALQRSEQHYRLLAENSTDLIAILDLEGRFRFASPSCAGIFGIDAEQVIGRHLSDFLGEPGESVKQMLDQLRPVGALVTNVVQGPCRAGPCTWIEATLKHTLGKDGSGEIVMNARDITERHNYQLAIEEIHRRNAKILDSAGEGLVTLNPQGLVVYANEQAQSLLGWADNSHLGAHCREVLCSPVEPGCGDHDDMCCPFLQTLKDGQTRQGRHSLCYQGDKADTVEVDFVCNTIAEADGVSGCVLVFRRLEDRPDNQWAEASEIILQHTLEAVMVTDADNRIVSLNPAFTEITGYTEDDAVGKNPRLLRSGVHTPNFYQDMWRQILDMGRWSGEIWNRRKNGEIYPQFASISTITDQDGRIKNYISVFSDISKAKKAEEKLFHLATHDALTDLPNRSFCIDQMGKMLERHRKQQARFAVAFIDLDNFKLINDTLGHAVGDIYLKIVADRISNAMRKQDMLARWGGDEFILAMAEISDRASVGESMQRIMQHFAQPIALADHQLLPTASIGLSLYPEDAVSVDRLITAADAAMYSAKNNGRNRFQFYTPTDEKNLEEKLLLSTELRQALKQNQLFLVFQPQVQPHRRHIAGVEALVRWRHPQRGIVPPNRFLPLAEELGLMPEIGNWVLREACRQMAEWIGQQLPIPQVAVNVAPCQLKPGFDRRVADLLQQTHLAARHLEIEITEGALDSMELVSDITRRIRALGVKVSIDDFGTGYSSLSHLRMFPITCFKIDKTFVDGLPETQADVAIVETILALGKSLRVSVVAEGVENAEQAGFLSRLGVDTIQGYHYGRPLPAESLPAWCADFLERTM